MRISIRILALFLIISTSQIAFGQSNKDSALIKGTEAIKLMDEGKFLESIQLLEEAQKLDPERFDYQYELAYAYYLKKDFNVTVNMLEKNKNHKDVTDRLFQLLGNSYDELGKPDNAFDAYDEGLNMFPNSGIIYLSKGNVHWKKKEYNKALPFYEKGIEMDPKFPSNYYRASKVYCSSTEEVWGMIYGEIFMNLERNSKRTSEVSKMLYDTYKSEIKFTNDTSFSVSFSQNASINVSDLKDADKLKLPFGVGVFEPTLMFSMLSVKSIDINTLDDIRSSFIDIYFKNGSDKVYPNVLFTYQKMIKDAGHIESYNHWLLMQGDEEGFNKWREANKEKWDKFLKWFADNRIEINNENKFYSGQY